MPHTCITALIWASKHQAWLLYTITCEGAGQQRCHTHTHTHTELDVKASGWPLYKSNSGGAGHRSPCLWHAKSTLYHISYTPQTLIKALSQHASITWGPWECGHSLFCVYMKAQLSDWVIMCLQTPSLPVQMRFFDVRVRFTHNVILRFQYSWNLYLTKSVDAVTCDWVWLGCIPKPLARVNMVQPKLVRNLLCIYVSSYSKWETWKLQIMIIQTDMVVDSIPFSTICSVRLST